MLRSGLLQTRSPTMSQETEGRNPLEMPKEVAEIAQKSVDQAQAAAERVGEFAHDNLQVFDAATTALKARTADFQLKDHGDGAGQSRCELRLRTPRARRLRAVRILHAAAGIHDQAHRAIIPPVQGVGRVVGALREGNGEALPGWLGEVIHVPADFIQIIAVSRPFLRACSTCALA